MSSAFAGKKRAKMGMIKSDSTIVIGDSTLVSDIDYTTEHLEVTTSSTTTGRHSEDEKNIGLDNVQKYGTTWIAWLQVLSIVLVNSACSLMWMSATSSPTAVSEWLNVGFSSLNWLSNVSAIVNTLFSLITGWAYEKFGIKNNIIFSGVMNFLGCWIRCLAIVAPINHRFTVMMVGQIVASIGGPFVYNIAAKLVSVWFAPEHRVVANTLATLSIGMAIAPILVPMLSPASINVPWMLILISIISTIATIPSIFLPSKPKILSSPSAEQDRMGVIDGFKRLIKISGFWWCLILCSVNAGMVFSVSVLIMEAIIPMGYTDMQAGYCAAAIVLAGFAGGVCSGYWAGKTGQHVMLIKLLTPMMMFSYIILIFELVPKVFPVILIACIQIGFFAYALFPLHLEVACEITYPIPEAITASLMWSMVTAAMLIFCVVIDALRAGPEADPPNNMKMSINAVAIIVCVGSLPVVWFKGDLKRLAYDKEEQKTF